MLRQGIVSAFVHAVVEYAVAVLLIAAPFLLSFESNAATALAIVAGVALLALAASSDLPASLAKMIPPGIHVAVDLGLAAVFIASPFLFGFSEESAPTAFFMVLGVAHLLLTIGTRFVPPRETRE